MKVYRVYTINNITLNQSAFYDKVEDIVAFLIEQEFAILMGDEEAWVTDASQGSLTVPLRLCELS